MPRWLIPLIYIIASVACGLILPRIEQAYFASCTFGLSVASAQVYLSAAASGTMALTGIVFAMAFVMVQFSAIAYSRKRADRHLWIMRRRSGLMPCSVSRSGWIFTIHLLIWIKQRRREDPMVLVHAAADTIRRALAAGTAPRSGPAGSRLRWQPNARPVCRNLVRDPASRYRGTDGSRAALGR